MALKTSNVPYQKLEAAYDVLKSVKKKLERAKIDNINQLKKNDISLPNFLDVQNKVKDTKWYDYKIKISEYHDVITNSLLEFFTFTLYSPTTYLWELKDQSYQIDSDGKIRAVNKETGNEKVSKLTYSLPDYKTAARAVGLPDVPFKFNKDNIDKILAQLQRGKIKYSDLVDECEKLNQVIDHFLEAVDAKLDNLITIGEAYKDLEKSAKNEFTSKNGQKYSKTQIAKKYGALVAATGSAKVAKKYLSKILNKTKSNLTTDKVTSIYKEWKKNKKKGSGGASAKSASSSNGTKNAKSKVRSTGGAIATGAVVASAGKKKSSKKKSKKEKGVLVGASVLAATKKGIKNEIKEVKSTAQKKIENAKILATDEKRKLEIEKNEKIAQINKKAAEEINQIDINDPNAQEKIDAIKAKAEKEVDQINEKYKQDIEKIDQNLASEIKEIESQRDQDVAELNKQMKELSKDKKKEGVISELLSSKSKAAGVAAVAATTTEKEVSVSNQQMNDATVELSDAYVGKSYHIENNGNQESINQNPSIPDGNIEVDNSNASAKVEIEESVASPIEPPKEEVNVSENVTPSYSSNESSTNHPGDVVEKVEGENQATGGIGEESKDTGIDQSNISNDIDESLKDPSSIEDDDIVSITSSDKNKVEKKKSGTGLGMAIPIGLGVAATGAAAVAGVRYVKNKRQNEDMDLEYDDENNNIEDDNQDLPSDSAYMRDDYLGPEGSSYQEVPDENSYTDTEYLEEEAGTHSFFKDQALDDLN